jgi:uncharacterized membrane protein (UPF0182 family)
MIGWLAARSDPPNYGRLIAYNFPKQKLVYGRARSTRASIRIRHLPAAVALEPARLHVIRGSLLAIPLDQSLIYVQPLYLARPSRARSPSCAA